MIKMIKELSLIMKQTIQPGSKIIIYLIGVLTIVSLKEPNHLMILAFLFTFPNIQHSRLKALAKGLIFSLPFIITAFLIGFINHDLSAGLLLAGKLVTIVLLNGIIFYNFLDIDLIRGLSQLKTPELITSIIFFIFRYYQVFKDELIVLQQARHLRGANTKINWYNYQVYCQLSQIIGAGLIRSLERSERVYQAMRLRGFKVREFSQGKANINQDWPIIITTLILVILIIMIDQGGLKF